MTGTPEESREDPRAKSAQLGAWDAASLVVGIVIGTTIFKQAGVIAQGAASPAMLFGLWALGGFLAFVGALCYAELGATYGGAGGDYQYLTRAFGPWAGFLFGWTQLLVVQTVNIALFAYVFAEYAWKSVWPNFPAPQSALDTPVEWIVTAAATVAVMTIINVIGLRSGKITQNILTALKLAGIALLIAAALLGQARTEVVSTSASAGNWTVAMIMILYAYGGWNDAAFVVAEVRDRQRNVPWALLFGVGFIAATYLAVNAAFVQGLGFAGLQTAGDAPVALMTGWWGASGGRAISAIILISALGAVNGLILSVSRLHAAVGSDHPLFSLLGRWSTRRQAPIGSLVVQAAFTIALLLTVGTRLGQDSLDAAFQAVTGEPLPWKRFYGKFDLLFAVGAPVFWGFFLMTGIAFFVLRIREPDRDRPFRTPLYPLPPLLFCGLCLFGIVSSVRYAGPFTWLGLTPVLIGVIAYFLERIAIRETSKSNGAH
jgi:amino acid transporter